MTDETITHLNLITLSLRKVITEVGFILIVRDQVNSLRKDDRHLGSHLHAKVVRIHIRDDALAST
jgi:hypothetical protein